MDFNEYQRKTADTVEYKTWHSHVYTIIGLTGEVGEVAQIYKRYMRRDEDYTLERVADLMENELGDVLWYLTRIASEMGLSLETIAALNIAKLAARKRNGTIKSNDTDRGNQ